MAPQRGGCQVAKACDHCRIKKLRCSGAMPTCASCQQLQRPCAYTQLNKARNTRQRLVDVIGTPKSSSKRTKKARAPLMLRRIAAAGPMSSQDVSAQPIRLEDPSLSTPTITPIVHSGLEAIREVQPAVSLGPSEQQVTQSIEHGLEQQLVQPTAHQSSQPTDPQREPPMEQSMDLPIEQPNEPPVAQPRELPVEQPLQQPMVRPIQQTTGQTFQQPIEQPLNEPLRQVLRPMSSKQSPPQLTIADQHCPIASNPVAAIHPTLCSAKAPSIPEKRRLSEAEGCLERPQDLSFSRSSSIRAKVERMSGMSSRSRATPSYIGSYHVTPSFDLARFSIPSLDRGLEMCTWFFEHAGTLQRILHRRSVETTLIDMCKSNDWLGGIAVDHRTHPAPSPVDECIVLLVWAIACRHHARLHTRGQAEWLTRKAGDYFEVAAMTLQSVDKEQDMAHLQVRLLMVLFAFMTCDLRAAWDLLGSTRRIAYEMNLSRFSLQAASDTGLPHLEVRAEVQSRVFWSLFTIDTLLCGILGKPSTYDMTSISTDLPEFDDAALDGEDDESIVDQESDLASGALSSGSAAHARISKVLRGIISSSLELNGAFKYQSILALARELSNARKQSVDYFFAKCPSPPELVVRQNHSIRFAYCHAKLLLYRSALPLAGLNRKDNDAASPDEQQNRLTCQKKCSEVAGDVHALCKELKDDELIAQAPLSTHVLFCATTIMLLYAAHTTIESDVAASMASAKECETLLQKIARTNKHTQQYLEAIMDLAAAVTHFLTTNAANTDANDSNAIMSYDTNDGNDSKPWRHLLEDVFLSGEQASYFAWDGIASGGASGLMH